MIHARPGDVLSAEPSSDGLEALRRWGLTLDRVGESRWVVRAVRQRRPVPAHVAYVLACVEAHPRVSPHHLEAFRLWASGRTLREVGERFNRTSEWARRSCARVRWAYDETRAAWVGRIPLSVLRPVARGLRAHGRGE